MQKIGGFVYQTQTMAIVLDTHQLIERRSTSSSLTPLTGLVLTIEQLYSYMLQLSASYDLACRTSRKNKPTKESVTLSNHTEYVLAPIDPSPLKLDNHYE